MQVNVQWVFSAERRVVQPTFFLVQLDDAMAWILRVRRKRVDLMALQVTQLELLPTRAFGLPNKSLPVRKESHQWRVVLPGLLLFIDHDTG